MAVGFLSLFFLLCVCVFSVCVCVGVIALPLCPARRGGRLCNGTSARTNVSLALRRPARNIL